MRKPLYILIGPVLFPPRAFDPQRVLFPTDGRRRRIYEPFLILGCSRGSPGVWAWACDPSRDRSADRAPRVLYRSGRGRENTRPGKIRRPPLIRGKIRPAVKLFKKYLTIPLTLSSKSVIIDSRKTVTSAFSHGRDVAGDDPRGK